MSSQHGLINSLLRKQGKAIYLNFSFPFYHTCYSFQNRHNFFSPVLLFLPIEEMIRGGDCFLFQWGVAIAHVTRWHMMWPWTNYLNQWEGGNTWARPMRIQHIPISHISIGDKIVIEHFIDSLTWFKKTKARQWIDNVISNCISLIRVPPPPIDCVTLQLCSNSLKIYAQNSSS